MKIAVGLSLLLGATSLSWGNEAEALMKAVHRDAIFQGPQKMRGEIRKGAESIEVKVFPHEEGIGFDLNGGKETFIFRSIQKDQQLYQLIEGKLSEFPTEKNAKPIAKSDLSYEDLAMTFLCWANPVIVGEETIQGQKCWRIHVMNPGDAGRYREVSVWVTKKQHMLLRMIGYGPNPARAALKKLEIDGLMKIKGKWRVKRMRVYSYDAKGNASGISTLSFFHSLMNR